MKTSTPSPALRLRDEAAAALRLAREAQTGSVFNTNARAARQKVSFAALECRSVAGWVRGREQSSEALDVSRRLRTLGLQFQALHALLEAWGLYPEAAHLPASELLRTIDGQIEHAERELAAWTAALEGEVR